MKTSTTDDKNLARMYSLKLRDYYDMLAREPASHAKELREAERLVRRFSKGKEVQVSKKAA